MKKNSIKKQIKNIINGVLIIFLMTSFTGCVNEVKNIEKPVFIPPPEIRLVQNKFSCLAQNNGDLWDCYLKLIGVFKDCNLDKQAIYEFYKTKLIQGKQ